MAAPPASLRHRPRPDGVDAAYWDGLEDGRVTVQRCSGCGRRRWFPAPRCPYCQSADVVWVEVRDGRLFTWTTTHRQFHPAFPDVPFTVCVVELEGDDAVHIVARLDVDQPDPDLEIDMPVRLEVVTDEDGDCEVVARLVDAP
jgi:hypothetical protein